jgi:hypothetical protein
LRREIDGRRIAQNHPVSRVEAEAS